MDGIVPPRCPSPPEAFSVQCDAIVWDGVGHENALDVVTELRQHLADRCAVLRRDDVVSVRPHQPVAGGEVEGSVASCREVIDVRPVVEVEILADDAPALHGNFKRAVWLLVAARSHHDDLVGDLLEVIEEAGNVVFGVAGDDAQAQFVFHICG